MRPGVGPRAVVRFSKICDGCTFKETFPHVSSSFAREAGYQSVSRNVRIGAAGSLANRQPVFLRW